VAAARAFGAREPDESVRNPDWLAERLLGPEEIELIRDHPISPALQQDYEQARRNPMVAGLSNFMLIRTRFIDDHLQAAIRRGATQVVILGAGFDTRAYRFSDLLRDVRVFEIDHQATQETKKRRLQEALDNLPPNVCFVETDFCRDALRDVLRAAGYQPSERTFFVWEGVTMYLTEGGVRDTLRTVAESGAGSSLVLDYACQATIDALRKFPNLSQHKHTTDWGEPWTFGVPDTRDREFFRECGLELRDTISLVRGDRLKGYLTRSDGTRLGRGRWVRRRNESTQTNRARRNLAGASSIRDAIRMLWMAATRRSKWYALAELAVPAETAASTPAHSSMYPSSSAV
jgi:methyltransferase (TIGR00027 family)